MHSTRPQDFQSAEATLKRKRCIINIKEMREEKTFSLILFAQIASPLINETKNLFFIFALKSFHHEIWIKNINEKWSRVVTFYLEIPSWVETDGKK